jgi:hypothetical protein
LYGFVKGPALGFVVEDGDDGGRVDDHHPGNPRSS